MRAPPRIDLQAATHIRSFTSFGADIDLTTESGCPKYPPSYVEVHNDEATTQDIGLRGGDATDVAVEVPADSVRVIEFQAHAIDAGTTETISSVTAYWWHDGTSPLN